MYTKNYLCQYIDFKYKINTEIMNETLCDDEK